MIKDLPLKLKELRTLSNLSQKDVAHKLNVSPSIISGYETGERTPSLENLLALSYLYKCTTDYLLGKTNSTPKITLDTDNLTTEQIHALQSLIKTIKPH
ncbi:MAG: helix-turn-helix transcriptional regulator [Lachnospiraceae bacterium]|nr:helix-turn-helix transcriptional regulator [Lachnospiraceae bacterium]